MLAPVFEIDEFCHVNRNVNGLQDFTTHVEYVKRSVRSVDEIHGPKPVVRGADKFRLLRDAGGRKRHAVRGKPTAVNEVVLGSADKDVAVKTFRIGAAAIYGNTGSCIHYVMTGTGCRGIPLTVGDAAAGAYLPPAL